jgi:hypothetical protein
VPVGPIHAKGWNHRGHRGHRAGGGKVRIMASSPDSLARTWASDRGPHLQTLYKSASWHLAVPEQSELESQTSMHPRTPLEICSHDTAHLPSLMSKGMVPSGHPQSEYALQGRVQIPVPRQ